MERQLAWNYFAGGPTTGSCETLPVTLELYLCHHPFQYCHYGKSQVFLIGKFDSGEMYKHDISYFTLRAGMWAGMNACLSS